MPELPEVETIRRGVEPLITGIKVSRVVVRKHLRQPVPPSLGRDLPGHTISAVRRRAKYLLLDTAAGTVLMHFGMSGTLRVLSDAPPPAKHDHVDFQLEDGRCMRFSDPRRFGLVLWIVGEPSAHPLLEGLGPEPLSEDFDGDYLYRRARNRRVSIKQFLMNGRVVAGLGNIYTSEALFDAGIRPQRQAGRIALRRYRVLAQVIKQLLQAALAEGGTTLRDFVNSEGRPGYFYLALKVYGRRAGEPCPKCARALRIERMGQRSTFYCAGCQR